MLKKFSQIIITVMVFCLVFTACSNKETVTDKKVSKDNYMLDTIITITLYGTEDDTVINDTFDLIRSLESNLSVHKEGSDPYNLKVNAGYEYTKVSDDTLNIINKSLKYYELSDHLFDISSGPLIKLWGIGTDAQRVPEENEIKEAISLINSDKILINQDSSEVMLADEGMFLDFGAIAKGYIADKAKEYIKSQGINNAIVNLGGNIDLVGSKMDGTDFSIGIQDPKDSRGSYLGILKVSDTSIVTSGDYERYFEVDGVRYHHILDPFTGYPANNDVRSVTIVTPSSFDADALSTSVLLLGMDRGLKLIDSLEDVEAIFVTRNDQVIVTEGIKDKFQLTNEEYMLVK